MRRLRSEGDACSGHKSSVTVTQPPGDTLPPPSVILRRIERRGTSSTDGVKVHFLCRGNNTRELAAYRSTFANTTQLVNLSVTSQWPFIVDFASCLVDTDTALLVSSLSLPYHRSANIATILYMYVHTNFTNIKIAHIVKQHVGQ